jgi:type II secretory pathway pseudopilin PulG
MKKSKTFLLTNEYASMWIPIRLLISISIISFFTALIVFGSQIATETVQQDRFITQLNDIKQSLTSLYAHGDCREINQPIQQTGSTRILHFEIPDFISSAYIGKKPFESDELMSSIRYQTNAEIEMIWLPSEIQLIAGRYQNDQYIPNQNNTGLTLHQGKNCITAELVCNQTQQFILLYPYNN